MRNDETKLADEIAAVVASDITTRFQGEVPPQRELREAVLESLATLISEPRFVVERATPATQTCSGSRSCANGNKARRG